MTIETKKMYSQVYSILNMLGETYKNKVPKKVLNVIENAKLDTYIPKYNPRIDLRQQDVMKESLAMIALIYMRCWCESEDEKLELKRMFDENEIKYKEEMAEKYNISKFKEDLINCNMEEQNLEDSKKITLAINKKPSFFLKIINKIKTFFRFK